MSDPVRLLILDDDDEIRTYLALALGGDDLRVETCGDPAELPDGVFAVALVDIMLGAQRADAVIATLAERGTSVVAMTGLSASSPAVAAARQAGAVEVLGKPFSLSELRAAVARYR